MILVFTYTMQNKLQTNIIQDDPLSRAEIYAIRKCYKDLKEYKEKNQTIHYHDYNIHFKYEDTTCYISIYENDNNILNSKLVYDDLEDYIESYSYIQ